MLRSFDLSAQEGRCTLQGVIPLGIRAEARVRTLRGDAGFEGGDEGGDHPAHAGVEKQLQHRGQPV
eukprot:6735012-Pyramimonas_sp.AAC.1